MSVNTFEAAAVEQMPTINQEAQGRFGQALEQIKEYGLKAVVIGSAALACMGVAGEKSQAFAETTESYTCTDDAYPTDKCDDKYPTGTKITKTNKDDGSTVTKADYTWGDSVTEEKNAEGTRTTSLYANGSSNCTWMPANGGAMTSCAEHDNPPTPQPPTGGGTQNGEQTGGEQNPTGSNPTTGGETGSTDDPDARVKHILACVNYAASLPKSSFGYSYNGKTRRSVFTSEFETIKSLTNDCDDVKTVRWAKGQLKQSPNRKGTKARNLSNPTVLMATANDNGLERRKGAKIGKVQCGKYIFEVITSNAWAVDPVTGAKITATKTANYKTKPTKVVCKPTRHAK